MFLLQIVYLHRIWIEIVLVAAIYQGFDWRKNSELEARIELEGTSTTVAM